MTTTLPTPTFAELSGAYTLDPIHSRIGFVARHAMVTKVRGSFNDFEGSAVLDGLNPGASSAKLVIKAESIDTRNAQRDEHLRSNDFLAMAEHPELTFTSTSARQVDDSTFELTGDLSVRGITRSVTIPFTYEGSATDPFGAKRVGFEGSTTISRKDYGITFNASLESGGVLVSDKVTLEFEISAVKND